VGILDDMGVSKLSAKVFFLKVNYSIKSSVRENSWFVLYMQRIIT